MGNRHGIKSEHTCTLPPEEDVIVAYIYAGKFVPFRRILRDITIIDENNPMSTVYFKSMTSIMYEKIRQMHYFYYSIHPFSKFRTIWEFCIMIVLLFSMLFLPVQTTYITADSTAELLKLSTDIIFMLDIFLTFFTGYYDQDSGVVVLKKTDIAINYIGEFFVFDLLSVLNIKFFFWIAVPEEVRTLLKFCNFCKVVRMMTLARYVENFKDYFKINPYTCKIAKISYLGIASIMWAASVLFVFAFWDEEDFLKSNSEILNGYEAFIICALRVVMLLFLVGNMQTDINSEIVLSLEILFIFIGAIINLYIFALIIQIVNKYNACGNKYYQLTQSLQEYATCMRLPLHLRQKIITYFDFKFEKVYYKENEIVGTISKHLQQAIVMHICKSLLESVEIFKDLPPSLLVNIVTSMKNAVFLPSDVIVQAGTEGDSMFFIHIGTVAIYTSVGKEVCHLGEGSHFGEIALMMEEKRVASVIAVDACELYSLSRKDFHKAIEPYPDLYTRIKALAQVRLAKTLQKIDEEKEHSKYLPDDEGSQCSKIEDHESKKETHFSPTSDDVSFILTETYKHSSLNKNEIKHQLSENKTPRTSANSERDEDEDPFLAKYRKTISISTNPSKDIVSAPEIAKDTIQNYPRSVSMKIEEAENTFIAPKRHTKKGKASKKEKKRKHTSKDKNVTLIEFANGSHKFVDLIEEEPKPTNSSERVSGLLSESHDFFDD